ncbi:MAG: cellulase family glycosylhydrolase [Candidatus Aureabacteria bacterium]|nr:cellulase family glycosylhydrolase [Candidatus Auribacterota bacterium]
MFQIKDGKLLKKGKPFFIKGINLGGWLMREGYIIGGRNIAEHIIWKEILKRAGRKKLDKIKNLFIDNFITDADFLRIKKLGFNTIRLPFNSKMLLKEKGKISIEGIKYLKRIIDRIKKCGLYVILDMHSAPGSQNNDWHSDSNGIADFWIKASCQKKFLDIWKALSITFKDEEHVIGYDILNEPNHDDSRKIFAAFEKAIITIRKNNDHKILFLEGNNWAQEIDFLTPFVQLFENIAISIHSYHPHLFSFNLIRGLKYPGIVEKTKWDKQALIKYHKKFADFAKKNKTIIFVGEFGIASRCPVCNSEFRLVEDMLHVFDKFKWHWTYWTYKAVAGMDCPDGLYQLNKNPDWLKRCYHTKSWENFAEIAKTGKAKDFKYLSKTLRTEYFDINKTLAKVLKKHL